MKEHKAEGDDLQAPDIGDTNPARLAVEVVAHVLLVKNWNAGLLHIAGHIPVSVLASELALLSTDKTFTSLED